MSNLLTIFTAIIFVLIISGCEDQITSQCETDNTNLDNVEPTLTNVQEKLFNVYCISCHSTTLQNGGLDLTSGQSYISLVGASSTSSSLDRVKPGNPGDSYLLIRLQALQGEAVMPPAGKLPQNLIDLASQWVSEGAQNN